MKVTLTKDAGIAGVAHKAGAELEVSEQVAALLFDCIAGSGKAKKKAAKKTTAASDG